MGKVASIGYLSVAGIKKGYWNLRANAPTIGGDHTMSPRVTASSFIQSARESDFMLASMEIFSISAMGNRLRIVFASQEYPRKSGPPPTTTSSISDGTGRPAPTKVCSNLQPMRIWTPAPAIVRMLFAQVSFQRDSSGTERETSLKMTHLSCRVMSLDG